MDGVRSPGRRLFILSVIRDIDYLTERAVSDIIKLESRIHKATEENKMSSSDVLQQEFGGKVIAIYNWVERETEKAVLVDANGQTWLPKSQVNFYKFNGYKIVALPSWLYREKRLVLSWKIDREKFINAVVNGEVERVQ